MSVTPQPQTPTQDSLLLTKLPRELRDMIYGQVFADSEVAVPHPLTQTSKQLRAEVIPIAARDIGSRARLDIFCAPCSHDFRMDTSVTMKDVNRSYCSRSMRLYTDKRSPPYPGAKFSWQDLCCGEFGKQMIPHVRHVRIIISVVNPQKITITFSKNSAPELSVRGGRYHILNNMEFRRICLFIAERYQEQKAVCSAEWIDVFVRDVVDAWFILSVYDADTWRRLCLFN